MPITEKQLAANRANGRKSTGPRTPEGKAAASMNAVRHGCFARTLLLPSEDPAQFEAFAAGLLDDLRPESPLETNIATRLVSTAWRLRRVPVAEAAIFSPDPIPTAPPPGKNDCDSGDSAHGVRSSNQKLLTPSSSAEFPAAAPSSPSDTSDPPDNLSSPSAAQANASATGSPPPNPGAHYLRRLRPGADPLAGISRHEARLHRQFDRDLQLFDAARERRLKREREDCEIARRRAEDPDDPLYDPRKDPLYELRQRRLARAQARRRIAHRPSAPIPSAPEGVANQSPAENGFVSADPAHGVRPPGRHSLGEGGSSNGKAPAPLRRDAPQPAGENGFVSADKPHLAVASSPDPSDQSHASDPNGFVSRKDGRLSGILDALYQDQLRIERRLGLPETDEEVQALV